MLNDSTLLASFQRFYRDFSSADLSQLSDLYAADVLFVDPVHRVQGLAALEAYFRSMGNGLISCSFTFESASTPQVLDKHSNHVFYVWRMEFRHKRLRGGEPVTVRGVSRIVFNERIIYHEDFYDMGAMLYEHLPLMGRCINWLRQRLGKAD